MTTTPPLPRRAALWLPALLLASVHTLADTCSDAAGQLESAEGRVEIAAAGTENAEVRTDGDDIDWQPLAIGDCIAIDSQIRVSDGRAVFRLANETLLRTAGDTQLRFSAPTQKRWIHLIDGLLHLITRTPRDLEVESEYVNAAVKGTEFIVASDRASATGQVIVLEGEVVAGNDRGERSVTGGAGIAATAGEAPRQVEVPALRDAVQWTLHYPPLPLSSQTRFAPVADALARGDLAAADTQLDTVPADAHDADYLTLRAAVDLQRGNSTQARDGLEQALQLRPDHRHALALQSTAEIAAGNSERASALLARIDGDDAATLIARSYLQQAQFDLPAARASAERAAALNADDALVQARTAELALMSGDTGRADAAIRHALKLQPTLARAHALDGFLQLQRLNLDAAERAFAEAARLDSNDPLPRLGLGLIEIRHDRLEAGRRQLELAVALDPGQSLPRSYLGKAYQLEQRDALAGDQYELAKQFDDADPTPWLYSALLAQSQNRPFEALRLIEESIARNDNRAVYRSRLQLDGDEATRTASQADIYRDLGFTQLAQRSAARAVTTAPGDYGGHRQLAESYADDPQYDAARASEVLQAQLLQPLSSTPIQPLLAETNLLVTEGSGPGALSYRNYDALFVRERPQVQVAGLGGSNSTGAGQVSMNGVENRLVYAVDYYHYETQGYRSNNDARYNIGSAYAGFQVNEDLSLMLTLGQRRENYGDITDHLFEGTRSLLEIDNRVDTATLGGRYAPSAAFELLGAITHREQDKSDDESQPTFFGQLTNNIDLSDKGEQVQLQGRSILPFGKLLVGTDWSEFDRQVIARITTTDPFLEPYIPVGPLLINGAYRYQSSYGYWSFEPIENLQLTAGAAYMEFDSDALSHEVDDWYPKLGVLYRIAPGFSLRAVYFESLKQPLLAEQTLEPTQLGGFNQFLDDREGTEARQYGIGFDADLGRGHHIGFELLERAPEIPLITNTGTNIIEMKQTRAQLFWSWATQPWAINVSYRYDHDENDVDRINNIDFSLADVPSKLTTQRLPVELNWISGHGLMLSATATYVDQKAERPLLQIDADPSGIPVADISIDRNSDSFMLFDLALRYRFWEQQAELSLLCNNVADIRFRFQSGNLYDVTPRISPYLPERTIRAGIKLSF